MWKNENEYYDITDIVVEKAFKILLIISRLKGVKCNRIRFSFRDFERKFIRKWSELMYKEFPYNYNSQIADCTDISKAKIRYLTNK